MSKQAVMRRHRGIWEVTSRNVREQEPDPNKEEGEAFAYVGPEDWTSVMINELPNGMQKIPIAMHLEVCHGVWNRPPVFLVSEATSSIDSDIASTHVERTIESLFESAREEYFEDGMESDFSRELVSALKKYGNVAMNEIGYLITGDRGDNEVASEALRWLGRIDDESTHGWRLWVLEKSLSSKSPIVRDGAALGLVYLGDAHALQHIKKAIEQETIDELRSDLQGALKELEASSNAISATDDKKA